MARGTKLTGSSSRSAKSRCDDVLDPSELGEPRGPLADDGEVGGVRSLGSAAPEFLVVGGERLSRRIKQGSSWWADAPPVPEWWSVDGVHETLVKNSRLAWAAAGPLQVLALRKHEGGRGGRARFC